MGHDADFERRLLRVCAAAGLFSIVAYVAAMVPVLPERIRWLSGFAMGPALALGTFGLGRYLNAEQKQVSAFVGGIFGVIAGALVNLMLVVQAANNLYFEKFLHEAPDEATRTSLKAILRGVSTVQLGIDVSWDIFIGSATVLFGYAMLGRRGVERVLGAAGMPVGTALLVLNLATFPEPPSAAGSVDVGPLVGLWYLFVSLRLLWILWRGAPPAVSAPAHR